LKELIDIVAIYLALGVGFVALWLGIYAGGDPAGCIARALLCCLGALALGMAAKAIWVMVSAMGGGRGARAGGRGAEERGEEGYPEE